MQGWVRGGTKDPIAHLLCFFPFLYDKGSLIIAKGHGGSKFRDRRLKIYTHPLPQMGCGRLIFQLQSLAHSRHSIFVETMNVL